MKEIRILFTGVGRRIELIEAFRQAALSLDINLKIYGADMAGNAPALAYCDHTRIVCGMKDENYIPELVRICRDDGIDVLIPTIDTDLLILSRNVSAFERTKVLISSPEMIEICRDKNNTSRFFEECSCLAPKTFNDVEKYTGAFPCFIKPKDGSSSINAFKVENEKDLRTYAARIEDYIIQPFIDGKEYTVDIFCDFHGEIIYATPRRRLQVRAGEVLKTQIVMDEKIISECRRIAEKFRPVGPMAIQLIRQNTTQDDYFIEINPRFGGGAPLSMKAGADSARALLKMLTADELDCDVEIDDGAIYSRFDQSVCISRGNVGRTVRGVIFDLDDTLYNERDYVRSGFFAVGAYLGNGDAADELQRAFESGKRNVIDLYLEKIGQIEKKQECLRVYREHKPNISFCDGALELIQGLRDRGIKIGVITDGRSCTQKNKIEALGLAELVDDIIITDELGGEQFRKPCDISFRIMQRKWKIPFGQLIYAGDNSAKDFQAPKQLGMQWMLINNGKGLYSENSEGVPISEMYKYLK